MYILRSCHLHVFHLHSFTMLRCSLLFRSISIEPRLSSLSVNPFASAGQMGKWCVCEWEVMAEFQRKIVYIAYSLHTKKNTERDWFICEWFVFWYGISAAYTHRAHLLLGLCFILRKCYICLWMRQNDIHSGTQIFSTLSHWMQTQANGINLTKVSIFEWQTLENVTFGRELAWINMKFIWTALRKSISLRFGGFW